MTITDTIIEHPITTCSVINFVHSGANKKILGMFKQQCSIAWCYDSYVPRLVYYTMVKKTYPKIDMKLL